MLPLKKRWQTALRISPEADHALDLYPPIMRQILYNRGLATLDQARHFLEARKPPGTEPNRILGVSEAVEHIQYAIRQHEPIAIYGDYDVDGVTATALLYQVLTALGGKVIGYIPNRFDEGYGLNRKALTQLHSDGVRLVITVDCGIRSVDEAEHAHKLGLGLIISDHHSPGEVLPNALAIINPKQSGDSYPEKDLAGVGLAYKLASSLIESTTGCDLKADDYLDLVALGTVADLAPLVGENRALVRSGLERIRRPRLQGIQSLIGVSRLNPQRITASDIGFALGPRLNAAGRIDSAMDALTLLTTSNIRESAKLAQQLEMQNRERQQITRQIQARAEQIAMADNPNALLLFAAHSDFNPGVVGLAASRLTDKFYRPAIVAHMGDNYTRGSCRSISEFHITHALDRCADILDRHGGHAAAAGFTVGNENLSELLDRLQTMAFEQLSHHDLRPTIHADIEIPLAELKPELLNYLEQLQPTGYGNRHANFISRDIRVTNSRTVGKDNNHLKLTVTDGWVTFDAIAFRQGYWQDQMPKRVDVAYTFELNEFKGRSSLQLNIHDLKPAGHPD